MAGPWDEYAAKAPTEPKPAGPTGAQTAAGLLRDFSGSAINVGGGMLESAAQVARPIGRNIGAPALESAADRLSGAGQSVSDYGTALQQNASAPYRDLVAGTQLSGEVMSPSTWDFGDNPSLTGAASLLAQGIGSTAPTLAAGALTRGKLLPSAAAAAASGGGVAAQGERDRILAMAPEDLAALPGYQQRLASMTPEQARAGLAEDAAASAFQHTAPVSAADAFTQVLPFARGTQQALARAVGPGRLPRTAAGFVAGGTGEAIQEVAESAATTLGANTVTGESRPLFEDTLADAALGFMTGGLLSGVGAATTSRADAAAEIAAGRSGAPVAPAPVPVTVDETVVDPDAGPLSRMVATEAAAELGSPVVAPVRIRTPLADERALDEQSAAQQKFDQDQQRAASKTETAAGRVPDNTNTDANEQNVADGVPFMVTVAMRRDLAAMGYTGSDIARLRPAEAWNILQAAGADSASPDPATASPATAPVESTTDGRDRRPSPGVDDPAAATPGTPAQEAAAEEAGGQEAGQGQEAPAAEAGSGSARVSVSDSREQLDDDIVPPSGSPFSIREAADLVAARTDGGVVVELDDGGFVVRTPTESTPDEALSDPGRVDESSPAVPQAEEGVAPAIEEDSSAEAAPATDADGADVQVPGRSPGAGSEVAADRSGVASEGADGRGRTGEPAGELGDAGADGASAGEAPQPPAGREGSAGEAPVDGSADDVHDVGAVRVAREGLTDGPQGTAESGATGAPASAGVADAEDGGAGEGAGAGAGATGVEVGPGDQLRGADEESETGVESGHVDGGGPVSALDWTGLSPEQRTAALTRGKATGVRKGLGHRAKWDNLSDAERTALAPIVRELRDGAVSAPASGDPAAPGAPADAAAGSVDTTAEPAADTGAETRTAPPSGTETAPADRPAGAVGDATSDTSLGDGEPAADATDPSAPREPVASGAEDTAVTPESDVTGPRAAPLEDAGENLVGARSWRNKLKAARTDDRATDAARLLDTVTRVAAMNVTLPDTASPGTGRFLDQVRAGLNSFTEYAIKRTNLWVRDNAPRQTLIDHMIGNEALYDQVEGLAADYMAELGALAAVLDGTTSVAEAESRLREALFRDPADPGHWTDLGKTVSGHINRYYGQYPRSFARQLAAIAEDQRNGEASATVRTKPLNRPKLDGVARENLPDYRNGKDVTAEDLVATFGFRGVNYGNYVNAKDRQLHTNHAFDALHDLAAVLGIPNNAISLGGTIGLSIGKEGSGKAAAHFEPGAKIINLTKGRGDGSLAHEWGHAFSDYLRDHLAGSNRRTAAAELRTHLHTYYSLDGLKTAVDNLLAGRTSIKNAKRAGPVGSAEALLEGRYWKNASWGVRKQTAYKRHGDELGKSYWGNEEELWARAFESWVHDRIDGYSPYLVSDWVADSAVTKAAGYRGQPYPSAEERIAFAADFEAITGALQATPDGHLTLDASYRTPTQRQDQAIREWSNWALANIETLHSKAAGGHPSANGLFWYLADKGRATGAVPRGYHAYLDGRPQDKHAWVAYPEPLTVAQLESFGMKATAMASGTAGITVVNTAAATHWDPLVERLYQDVRTGHMPADNLALRKAVAALDGKPVAGARMKQAQEALEVAIVRRARDLVAESGTDRVVFDKLLGLYESQPNLNVRTSTSIANQAYSTPAPLAFLAGRLAGIDYTSKVYEPTAGNGMLLIGAAPANASANELSDDRHAALLAQGFATRHGDALEAVGTLVEPGSQDAVVSNPPFDANRDAAGKPIKVEFDGYRIGKLDHLIVADALRALNDDGKATLIIGANMVPGQIGTDDRIFFNWLYSHYNVTGHFEVDGKLYSRQGASWPVRVITIHGRVSSDRVTPQPGDITRVNNWNDVYDRYAEVLGAQERAVERPADVGRGPRTEPSDGTGRSSPPGTDSREGGATGESRRDGRRRDTGSVAGEPAGAGRDSGQRTDEQLAERADEQRPDAAAAEPDRLDEGKRPPADAADAGRDPVRAPRADVARADRVALTDADNAFQTAYTPRSSRKDEGVLVPVNMAQPMQDALSSLEDAVGDIDAYVTQELGYKTAEAMHEALMGLQVDSVASAIYQNKVRGKGVIIADQTGIGKGRQAAAMIRWAIKQGMTPVFVTVKPSLFTDMHGDLADIGSKDVKPMILNKDEWIKGPGDTRLFANKATGHAKAMKQIAATGELPSGSNALFMTYSQINTDNVQRKVLQALAPNAFFVMDESHNAAGASGTGEFIREVLAQVRGVTYLSATYAKRPDNLPVYFRTDIADAIEGGSEALVAAMQQGGVPLQTVVANGLVQSGQMFRRERSYDGVSITTKADTANRDKHTALSDRVTLALRAIVAADREFHRGYVAQQQLEAKLRGEEVSGGGNKAAESVNHAEFSSVVHNFVKQLLLGLKADTAADEAIANLKAGRKPLIALESTMGSFLAEYAADNALSDGDLLGAFDYRTVLARALERTRYITVEDAQGNKKRQHIGLNQLDANTRRLYQEAQRTIEGLDGIADLPVSPIDWIRHRITQAGYSVAEITGRALAVDYSGEAPKLARVPAEEQSDKVKTTQRFNAGKLDVIVLNVSGSTGISLHASERFKDQLPRHMIVAQAAADINIFMQMLGRVHRTGQVALPGYTILNVDLPAEKRPTAVLNRKMKSLNANTSSNADSATSVKAGDFLNKYGDQIVNQYLYDNILLASELGVSPADPAGESRVEEDIARKATGRLALMPVEVQTAFYQEVEQQYADLIDYLDKTGQNDLEPRTLDYDAELLEEHQVLEARNPDSPFGRAATYGEYRIKAQGKAMTLDEITAELDESLGDHQTEDTRRRGDHGRRTAGDAHAQAMIQSLAQMDADAFNADRDAIGLGATYNEGRYRARLASEKMDEYTADSLVQQARAHYAAGGKGWEWTADNSLRRPSVAGGVAFIRQHPVGSMWRVEINGDNYNAVVTNLRNSHRGSGNPFSLSKIQVTLAVNGPLRQLVVPASQWGKIEVSAIGGYGVSLEGAFRTPAEGTQRAKIITGNLLGAYGEMRGSTSQIVTFSKKDGSVEQGILLPKKFDVKKNTYGDYQLRTPADVLQFLGSTTNPDADRFGVAPRDQTIRIQLQNDGSLLLSTPRSKAKGGKFFLNKKLLAVTGDFVSSGDLMRATVPKAKASEALAAVMANTAIYAQPSMAEEARDMLAKQAGAFSQPEAIQTGTPAFRKWFGDSEVVGEDGKPLVVYHGTSASFDVFDGDEGAAGWFSESPELAEKYASNENRYGAETMPQTYPVYLSVKRPVELSYDMNGPAARAIEDARDLGVDVDKRWGTKSSTTGKIYYSPTAAWVVINSPEFMAAAQAHGFDGIRVKEKGYWSWAAFEPTQIKSATGNSGAFDPYSPNIRQSRPAPGATGWVDTGVLTRAVQGVTGAWRGDIPTVRVVTLPDELPAAAKTGRGWKTAEGWYDGRGAVYLVANNIPNTTRGLQVLAHEALGHYGVEAVLGKTQWTQVVGDVARLRRRADTLPADMRGAMASTLSRYGKESPATFAREFLAVLAERDVKSSLTARVLAGVRRWLRAMRFPIDKWAADEIRQIVTEGAKQVTRRGRRRQADDRRGAAFSAPEPEEFVIRDNRGKELGRAGTELDANRIASRMRHAGKRVRSVEPVDARVNRIDPDTGASFHELPEVRAALDAANGDLSSLLDSVARLAGSDPFYGGPDYQWLAKKLSPLVKQLGVKLVDPPKHLDYAGAYTVGTNAVWIRQAVPEVILHESLHAVTSALMTSPSARRGNAVVAKAVAEFNDLLATAQAHAATLDMAQLPAPLRALLENPQGALSNIKELLTYGMTERTFQQWLDTVPAPLERRTPRSAWQWFKDTVAELVAPKERLTGPRHTLLGAIIESAGDLVQFAEDNPGATRLAQFTESSRLAMSADPSAIATVRDAADRITSRPRNAIPGRFDAEQAAAAEKFVTFQRREKLSVRVERLKDEAGKRLVQRVFDQFRPLRDLDETAFQQAHMAKGTDGALEAAFVHGIPELDGGAFNVTERTGGFKKVLAALKGEHDQFLMWVVGNRAEGLRAEGREHLFTPADIAAMKRLNEGTLPDGNSRRAAYGKALLEYNRYNKAMLDIGEKAGVINKEGRAIWEQEFYLPFFREMDRDPRNGPGQIKGLLRQRVIERLVGGQEPMGDPLENILANWSHMLTASMKNMAATKALAAGVKAGIAEAVDGPQKGAVWAMHNGVESYYLVHDPMVLEALESLSFNGFDNAVMRAAGKFKRVLTTTVTINPSFRIRNLARDVMSAMATAEVGYNPVMNMVDGMRLMSVDKHGVALLAGGGRIRFGTINDGAQAQHAKRMVEAGIPDRQILDTRAKMTGAMRRAYDWWQEVGDKTETVNRALIYDRAIAAGQTHLQASFAARDLMNFTSMGSASIIRALSQVLPFFNARLQGLDRLGRGAIANPVRFTAVTGVLALASMALYLLQADDDDYKALPDYVRDTYWPVKIGGQFYYIPKPFEVGAMATVVERATELAVAGDDYQAKDFARTLLEVAMSQLAMNPIPQAVRPAMEAAFNYDLFRDAPIDSMGQQNLLPQDRYTARTRAGAVAAGQLTGLSPQRLEHMVRGYFGWVGVQALNVSDYLLRDAIGMPAAPHQDLTRPSNLFVVGDFVKDSASISSKYVTRFYDQQNKIDKVYASVNMARRTGDTARAQALAASPKLALRPLYQTADKQISKINRQIRAVTASPTLTAAEKGKKLDLLNKQRAAIAMRVDAVARARK